MCIARLCFAVVMFSIGSAALAGDRDIQVRSIDLAGGVVELHNFGLSTISLDGWRFCTHDFDQARRYTAAAGLDGISLIPGASLFVHYKNDGPGLPAAINIASLGGLIATPLNSVSYAFEIFTPGTDGLLSFGSSSDMNDHVQWAINPASVGFASIRSAQAVLGGLWVNASEFVVVTASTSVIMLTDDTGGELHRPSDYVLDPSDCPPDTNGDGILDNGDIGTFVSLFLAGDLAADFNGDGFLDNGDIGAFIEAFLAGC